MGALPPTIDDTAIWDAWLSQFRLPILNANLEVGTFEALSDGAYTTEELAQKLGVDARALAMHLAALSADGFVEKRLGQWRATHLARTWLHPQATGFWGHFLGSIDRNEHLRGRLLEFAQDRQAAERGSRPAPGRLGAGHDGARGGGEHLPVHARAQPGPGARRRAAAGVRRTQVPDGRRLRQRASTASRSPARTPGLKVILMDLKEVAAEAAQIRRALRRRRAGLHRRGQHVHRGLAARRRTGTSSPTCSTTGRTRPTATSPAAASTRCPAAGGSSSTRS